MAGVDVLVGRYDVRGSSASLQSPTNDRQRPSGGLWQASYEVEGALYAQPLIVSSLRAVRWSDYRRNACCTLRRRTILSTLDADDPGADGSLLWQVPDERGRVADAPSDKTAQTVQGNLGVLSTPVIDRTRSVLYVVARTLGPTGYRQRLHARLCDRR